MPEGRNTHMIKGRLFVVDAETLQNTINSNIVSIKTPRPEGEQWLKTIADIMADMLQIEFGDYIFLWEIGNASQKSRIHGIYRAISTPYYEMTNFQDRFPFKINVELAYEFHQSLDEYDILNCPYIKEPLWTIIGKKVAGKSRGTSPLSPTEVQNLITLLIGKNPDYCFFPPCDDHYQIKENRLRVDYNKCGESQRPRNLSELNPNELSFFDERHNVKYEKVLETVFNQEMSAGNCEFFDQLGIDPDKVIWFANYLPYSIEQSETDYFIIESDDGMALSRMFLIEFIKTPLDYSHIYRSLLYSKWINETLALGCSIAQPMIICPFTTRLAGRAQSFDDQIKTLQAENGTRELEIYGYDFANGTPSFRCVR